MSDLNDVKAGDMVTVFPVGFSPRESAVQRVTKHLIILQGGDKYSRHYGTLAEQRGNIWSSNRTFIAIGEKAEQAKKERAANILRSRAAHAMNIPRERLSRETVTVHREACDKAEVALRELGEWE